MGHIRFNLSSFSVVVLTQYYSVSKGLQRESWTDHEDGLADARSKEVSQMAVLVTMSTTGLWLDKQKIVIG